MKSLIVVILALTLAACTAQQAQDNTLAAIDAACTNLPAMDGEFQLVAPNASQSTRNAYAASKATLTGVCNSRPIDPRNAASILKTVSNALAALLTAINTARWPS